MISNSYSNVYACLLCMSLVHIDIMAGFVMFQISEFPFVRY